MKTQINTLHRGHGSVIGSKYEERKRISDLVHAENPEILNVKVGGIELTLRCNHSKTGKTFWYASGHLPVEIVAQFFPGDRRAIEHPELAAYEFTVSMDMKCQFDRYGRRTVNAMWKWSSSIEVQELTVTIL